MAPVWYSCPCEVLMKVFMLQPGDFFTFKDVYEPSGRLGFGVVLENRSSLVIRGDGALAQYAAQLTRLPHNAEPLNGSEPTLPSEVRLALDAVVVAFSLQRRPE